MVNFEQLGILQEVEVLFSNKIRILERVGLLKQNLKTSSSGILETRNLRGGDSLLLSTWVSYELTYPPSLEMGHCGSQAKSHQEQLTSRWTGHTRDRACWGKCGELWGWQTQFGEVEEGFW